MNDKSTKTDFLSTMPGVVAAATLANLLWGSASPCIKLGFRYFGVESADVMSQILFAGVRFTLAGVLTVLFGSLLRRRLLLPKAGSGGMILTLAMALVAIVCALTDHRLGILPYVIFALIMLVLFLVLGLSGIIYRGAGIALVLVVLFMPVIQDPTGFVTGKVEKPPMSKIAIIAGVGAVLTLPFLPLRSLIVAAYVDGLKKE